MKACSNCGMSLADDQRYCLECGTRQVQARSQFLERFTPAAAGPRVSSSALPQAGGRSANTTALAGVGVLLLAMGVGVLIGRASGSTSSSSPQVISVNSPAATNGAVGTGAPTGETSGVGSATSSTTVPEDWPVAKSGYTVQLQTFSSSTAQASEVLAAKTSAEGKGATAVGILLSSNFTSLPADRYVLYSGDYSSEAQARRALSKLKPKFSSAAVIRVNGASGGGSANSSPSSTSKGGTARTGSSNTGKGSSGSPGSSSGGNSAEQKSLSLPNVVTTG